MWAPLQDAPVDRVVRNLSAYTQEHPDDADGWYALGRAHSLAFSRKVDQIPVIGMRDEDTPSNILMDDGIPGAGPRKTWNSPPGRGLSEEERLAHLKSAAEAFGRALAFTEWTPRTYYHRGHFHMSLAYLLESGSDFAGRVDLVPDAPPLYEATKEEIERYTEAVQRLADQETRKEAQDQLREGSRAAAFVLNQHRDADDPGLRDLIRALLADYWRERAMAHYLDAFRASFGPDMSKDTHFGGGLRELVTHEAAQSYLRLVRNRGERASDRANVEEVSEGLKKLKKKTWGEAVTPIVFSLERAESLDDLLATGSRVTFDLDGTGQGREWPWVKPATAILVWDPSGVGAITSGRQLLGSVSWWLFFRDGYRALDALDDNRDGELTGLELRGLSLWFDGDSDGVSDPGEVAPVERFGIAALSTRVTGKDGRSPMNATGLRLTDGRVLPTYDWVVEPLSTGSESSSRPGWTLAWGTGALAAPAFFGACWHRVRRRRAWIGE